MATLTMDLREMYLHQWVKTVGDHFSIDVAWGTGFDPFRRMRLTCHKCSQTLTCDMPETAEKVDWALQKFVTLHRHDPVKEAEEKALIKEVQDKMNAPKVTPVSTDFKPIKALRHKEGRRFRETN